MEFGNSNNGWSINSFDVINFKTKQQKTTKYIKILIVACVALISFSFIKLVRAATQVDFGTAEDFAILAGSTITNTGSSVINGDLGLSPGTSVTGFPPGTLNGTSHIGDSEAIQAKVDLNAAYTNAANQTPVTTVPTELGSTTKTPGSYDSAAGTFQITGALTLDADDDPNAVFIFKTATTLITAGSSEILLINGAQACNVFWQVGSSATLGANSTFFGNIMAADSITLGSGADVEGRVLARSAAVTLSGNIVTLGLCVPPAPPLINVSKVPDPLVLPPGGGSVTYDYVVINPGTVAMTDVVVTDNRCSPVTFISGDIDTDLQLDVTETWNYSCTTNLTETTSNIVTARGEANGFTATDTANATVIVGGSPEPPLIHLIKVPNVFVLPSGGGTVIYTYTVTNPGIVALTDVSVSDNRCSPVTFVSGDTDDDLQLDTTETWIYTCTDNLDVTTLNTAVASGTANSLTINDPSLATVVVAVEVTGELPDTALFTEEQTVQWPLVILVFCSAFLLCLRVNRRVD